MQGLPLYLSNVLCSSLHHGVGLLVTFQHMMPSLQIRRGFPNNLFFSFSVSFLFAENFHAFEGCNHVASSFLFLSQNNYSQFILLLQFMSPQSAMKYFTLHQALSNHPHIVGFRDSKLDSSLELCFPLISFPSRQILSHMMRLFFIS